MTLNSKIKQSGFTIVELLIVIVIIAILAAITIVAYNGIQQRANTAAAQTASNTMIKKLEAYNALKSTYPTGINSVARDMSAVPEATLAGTGLAISPSPNASNGKTTLKVELCAGTGVRVTYWDYTKNAVSAPDLLGTATPTTSCLVANT